MEQRILVGLDTSDRAAVVLNSAVQMARRLGQRLVIVRAVDLPIGFPIEELTVAPEGLPARMLARSLAALELAVSGVPKELMETAVTRIGTPWKVICEAAAEFGCDLIVVGTHGHGALHQMVGSTAARVVNHAPCSVLAVRPSSDG